MDLDSLTARLQPIFAKYKVQRALLFGSYARGEPSRRSDLDLLLVQETDKRFLDRYDGILSEVITAAGRDVDMLIYTPDELERISHRPFIATILREGKLLYESEQEPV